MKPSVFVKILLFKNNIRNHNNFTQKHMEKWLYVNLVGLCNKQITHINTPTYKQSILDYRKQYIHINVKKALMLKKIKLKIVISLYVKEKECYITNNSGRQIISNINWKSIKTLTNQTQNRLIWKRLGIIRTLSRSSYLLPHINSSLLFLFVLLAERPSDLRGTNELLRWFICEWKISLVQQYVCK